EGLGDAPRGEGVGQGADHGLLADQVLKAPRPVFAGDDGVGRAGFRGRRRGRSRGRRAKHLSRSGVPLGRLLLPGRRAGIVWLGHRSIKHYGHAWRKLRDKELWGQPVVACGYAGPCFAEDAVLGAAPREAAGEAGWRPNGNPKRDSLWLLP